MNDTPQDTLALQNIPRALIRHKRKAIGIFLSIVLLAAVAMVVCPRKYLSDAKLFVRVGRESVTLDPTATTGETIGVYESREVEINSILEVLTSRAIMEKVVDAVGPEVILDKKPGDKESKRASLLPAGFSLSSNISLREKAVADLEDSLKIGVPKKTSIITVRCKTYSPQVAQKIVATMLDVYQQEHVRVNKTPGSYDFFVQQSNLLKEKLETATDQLREAKNEMHLTTLQSKREILQDQVGTIEKEIVATRTQLAASEAKVAALQKTVDKMPVRLVTDEVSGFANAAADGMRQQLYQLQIAEREMLSKFTPAHPQVIALREQVEKVKSILDKQAPGRVQSTSAVNPQRRALELNLLTENSEFASLSARDDALVEQHQLAVGNIKSLNAHEVKLAKLQRQVQLTETSYMAYASKLEQARINHELENQRISNVNIAQPASFIAKPVSPKRSLVALMALFAATMGAIGIAIFCEHLDPSLNSADEVEQHLELPVMLSVPRIPQNNVLVN